MERKKDKNEGLFMEYFVIFVFTAVIYFSWRANIFIGIINSLIILWFLPSLKWKDSKSFIGNKYVRPLAEKIDSIKRVYG